MLSHLKKYHIVLASASPRRQELLRGLDIPFVVQSIDVEEDYPNGLTGAEIPCFLAKKKADAYSIADNTLLITADTLVWLDGAALGKPLDKAEARAMLHRLSGKTHEVITGVCLKSKIREKVFFVSSKVRFALLSESEINYYLEKYRPYDKAGSYGVQEWIGYIGVEHIEGSYYNIMGLPVQRLYRELMQWEGAEV